jgi:hypothetical protein
MSTFRKIRKNVKMVIMTFDLLLSLLCCPNYCYWDIWSFYQTNFPSPPQELIKIKNLNDIDSYPQKFEILQKGTIKFEDFITYTDAPEYRIENHAIINKRHVWWPISN